MSQPRARALTTGQHTRLHRAADDAARLYPHDPTLQCAAVEAAIDYLCGEADLRADGAEWHRVRQEEKRIRARVRQLAVMSIADGTVSERSVARVISADRMRLRRWSGKPSPAGPAGPSPAKDARR